MKQKIIIDTDCGSDDAMAIAMAMNDTKYEVLMISTVAGNVTLDQATDNTLLTLEKVNTYFPPVYKGCATMLNKQLFYAYETHGNDGMGDYGYKPTYLKCNEDNGILKMLEILEKEPNKTIDIIALGPLTNIAVAFKLNPDSMNRARNIYVMGTSGLGVGNVSPVAEFNIWQDPEAAKAVVEAGFPNLYFIGWDACLDDNMLDKDDIERISTSGELGKFVIEINRKLLEINYERFSGEFLDMADPAAMAAALHPECIDKCKKYYCEVDTSKGPSEGGVLIDVNEFDNRIYYTTYINNYLVSVSCNDYSYKETLFDILDSVEILEGSEREVENIARENKNNRKLLANNLPELDIRSLVNSFDATIIRKSDILKRAIAIILLANEIITDNNESSFLNIFNKNKNIKSELKKYDVYNYLTAKEKEYLKTRNEDLSIELSWRIEGAYVLLYVLGLIDKELNNVTKTNIAELKEFISSRTYGDLIIDAKLKDEDEILDLADYSNRLLIITENYTDYNNLDKEIVIERDKAYKYILSGMSWDVL